MEHIIDKLNNILNQNINGAIWDSSVYDEFAGLIQEIHDFISNESFGEDGMSYKTLKRFSQLSTSAQSELQGLYDYYKKTSASPNLMQLLYTSIAFFKVNIILASDYLLELENMVSELSSMQVHNFYESQDGLRLR